MHFTYSAVVTVVSLMAVAGCASVSVSTQESRSVIGAGEVERVQAESRRREEKIRLLADKYREQVSATSSAGQARARTDTQPKRLSRTSIRAALPTDRGSGKVSGGKHIAAHFIEVPLRIAAAAFTVLTETNIVVAEEIAAEMVTLRTVGAPWRDTLSELAEAHGWMVQEGAGFIRVRRAREDGDGMPETVAQGVELLRFFYIAPDDLKKAAAPLFVDAARKPVMSVDERTASLVVKGTSDDVALIAALAEKLDRPVQQVLIETFIVEAGKGVRTKSGCPPRPRPF